MCICERQRERRPCRGPHCCSCQEQSHRHAPVLSLAMSPRLPTPPPAAPRDVVTTKSCQPQALSTSALLFHIWPQATSETSPGSRDNFPWIGQVHPDSPVTSKRHRPLGKVVTCSHFAGCHGGQQGLGEFPGTSKQTARPGK